MTGGFTLKHLSLIVLLILGLALGVSCTKKDQAPAGDDKAKSEAAKKEDTAADEDSILYAMGYMHGERLSKLEFTEKQQKAFEEGFREAMSGKDSKIKIEDYQVKIRDFYTKQMKDVGERNKKKGSEFLEKFLKDEGGQKTASGMGFKVLQEGTGRNPKETDVVEVHYRGTFIDGKEFDSSYSRKEMVSFPLNRVILGWKEGLQKVKEGGKIKLVVPSELAYGEFGAPPKIPGGATLVFEVELFKIVDQEKKDEKKVEEKKAEEKPATPAKKK